MSLYNINPPTACTAGQICPVLFLLITDAIFLSHRKILNNKITQNAFVQVLHSGNLFFMYKVYIELAICK